MADSVAAATPQPTDAEVSETIQEVRQSAGLSDPGIPLELKLSTGQTYKGKDQQELLNQLQRAQENASEKIRQQTEELNQLRSAQTKAPPAEDGTFDSTVYYQLWADGKDGPIKAKQYMDGFDPSHKEWQTAIQQSKQNAATNAFKAAVGFNPTPEQANAYAAAFATSRLDPTPANLELVYWRMVNTGQLEVNAPATRPGKTRAPASLGGGGAPPAQGMDATEFSRLPAAQQKEVIERLERGQS